MKFSKRHIILLLFLLYTGLVLSAQDRSEGKVTFITSQHVYVNLGEMENLSEGDTLYLLREGREVPALQIKTLSSISAVCVPLLEDGFKVSDVVFALSKIEKPQESAKEPTISNSELSGVKSEDISELEDSTARKQLKQEINGRLSVSSYSALSNDQIAGSQRMRYTFSIDAHNLGNSKVSAESYISFAHNNSNWEEVKENIFNGLKIYNLSLKYDFNESTQIILGRKINPKLSSVGAIDGVQFEKSFGSFTAGIVAGSRPDYLDYGINMDLLQYGLYLGHVLKGKNGNMQNTLAFMEQTNHSMTDRRFLYFQQSNMLVKNLFFFGSAEVDLYKKVNDSKETVFNLTNTYLSLRYRIIRPLTVGLSFSARNNIIYYETYKDFLERLLETETLQGWRFRINYRPVKYMFIGINAGYRFRKEDPRPTKNFRGYITYSQVPGIGASVTLSSTWLETSYLKGTIYGLGISRDIISGKLSGGLKYRYVDYLYQNSEMPLIQNVGEANLSWNIYKKLSLSIYYEGTFEKEIPYHRLYLNVSQRF